MLVVLIALERGVAMTGCDSNRRRGEAENHHHRERKACPAAAHWFPLARIWSANNNAHVEPMQSPSKRFGTTTNGSRRRRQARAWSGWVLLAERVLQEPPSLSADL